MQLLDIYTSRIVCIRLIIKKIKDIQMKKLSLLLGVIFALTTVQTRAQITEVYHQGFENGESANYSITGSAAPQSSVYSGGSRALKLSHTNTSTTITLDTIDLTTSASLQHFSLEFVHICNVSPNSCADASLVAVIEIKRPGVNNWTTLSQAYYNTSEGGGSTQFVYTSTFSDVSYPEWTGATASNTLWKSERFDLDGYFRNVSVVDRKLQVRMTLMARTASGSSNSGWFLDDISIKVSPQDMIKPTLSMVAYPDLVAYPNSRGAEISADISTSVSQGMCLDSVYLQYKIGSDNTIHRLPTHLVSGRNNRYAASIPFCGFDTIVEWRLVARDATTNHNTRTFPKNETAWSSYRFVRGYSNSHDLSTNLSNNSNFPFPAYGDNRCEFVYDSATLAAAGYRPGAITALDYTIQAATLDQTRERFQIKMLNVPTNYQSSPNYYFNSDFMKVVYDGQLTILASSPETVNRINLQDTFFYAGQDILIQITNDNASSNPAATTIKAFPTAPNKQTIYIDGYNANMGYDPFTSSDFNVGTNSATSRPHFVFKADANLPLVHDGGVCAMSYPNYYNAATAGRNDSVVVWLKNYGAAPLNAVQISYSVDNAAPVHYNWTGTLAAGDSVRVRVSSTQQFPVGYHTMKAWVEDTVTSAGARYRDHEPFNDTVSVEFISCAGAMGGTRQVGGSNADFETLEAFLFSLERCGVNAPLTVKLAPGYYDAVTIPSIPGSSTANYVLFEPLSNNVTFQNTASVQTIVDMRQASHIRFNNVNFVHASGTVNSLVSLDYTSSDCRFTNCSFVDNSLMPSNTLISSGGADSLIVDSCSFEGGTIGVDMTGRAQDLRAKGNKVAHSTFNSQVSNAVCVVNQDAVVVDSNDMYDVTTNASYIILARHCYGASKITANKIYTTHGASALGVADVYGTMINKLIIANNMIVCVDDGQSNLLSTPLNIISAQHTKVVYNSVKMIANERSGVAAASLGGGSLSNVSFQNNIIACMDENNYAFSFVPGNGSFITVGNNVYYSRGDVLNKYAGSACSTLQEWRNSYSADNSSRCADPMFLNGSRVDLRSYNQQVKGCGTPISEVTSDMFGNARDAQAPCAGAFEFVALFYDFNIQALASPEADYCNAPGTIPLDVVIHNTGVNAFDPASSGSLTLHYSYGSTRPGAVATVGAAPVQQIIPAGDTATVFTGVNLLLPPNGTYDETYNVHLYLTSSLDPNSTNDTSDFTVISRYHPAAPTAINQSVAYGQPATVNVTSGIDQWPICIVPNGRQEKSKIYWYTDSLATEPFYSGYTLITDPIYDDTSFFIAQHRDIGLMKITEVQLNRTNAGFTSPFPTWFGTSTKFAIELTNVGDYPANLAGDTIRMISATTNYHNKNWVLPNVTVQPGQTIVLQFRAGTTTDSSKTLYYGTTLEPALSTNFAVIYRDGGGIADAVAFNDITTDAKWTAEGVPTTMWNGQGIIVRNLTTAGVKRHGWPGNGNAATYWTITNNDNRMTLGTADPSLVLYTDNGCVGDRSKVTLTLSARPTSDIFVDTPVAAEGCGLTNVPISVGIHNYGLQASGPINIHYSTGTTTVSDVIADGLAAGASSSYTFTQPLNMQVSSDSVFDLVVWVDSCAGDFARNNDTARASFQSKYTPGLPDVNGTIEAVYGSSITLAPNTTPTRSMLKWYDSQMNAVAMEDSYTTPLLYHIDTFYVSAVATNTVSIQVGSATTTTTPTSATQPSPYNSIRKYTREQYLYTADELLAAGLSAGPINSIAFYLDSVMGVNDNITFSDYSISIGTTSLAVFASSGNNWISTTPYFTSNNFVVSKAQQGWLTHQLDTPFVWDGSSNIVVQVCRTIDNVVTTGVRTRYSSATNKALYKTDNTTSSMCGITTAGSRSANRPNVLFGLRDLGCEGPAKQIVVTMRGVPDYEAGLAWPAAMDTTVFNSCGNSNVNVVVKNRGANTLSNYSVQCSVDGGAFTSVTGTTNIAPGNDLIMNVLPNHSFTPGRHTLVAIVNASGDTVLSNDTIRATINAHFCAGTYTIGTNGDYATFQIALDTLSNAGVDGPVVFNVSSGTYNEQLQMGAVSGASDVNTITFQSATSNAEDVTLRFAPVTANNYVLSLSENVSHLRFKNLTIYAAGSGNFSNAVVLSEASDIDFDHVAIRVKGTINNVSANAVSLGSQVSDIRFLNCAIDSGYYAIYGQETVAEGSQSLVVDSCAITGFWFHGVDVSNVKNLTIRRNNIRSGVSVASRALTAVSIGSCSGSIIVEKNFIVLNDNNNGAKTGLVINNTQGTNINRVKVYNNMISLTGTGNASGISTGILMDGTSKYVNIYYNTVRLYTSDNKNTTAAFKANASVTNLYVLNNIFANLSMGYAYYASANTNITTSNYNNYYSVSPTRFAFWGAEAADLTALRNANHTDANSGNSMPYFVSDDDLHLTLSNMSARAQYNADVPDDIDGTTRPPIPAPTIGAHEFPIPAHDVSIARIVKPTYNTTTNNPYVESDPFYVVVEFFNNGSTTERNLTWYAELQGVAGTTTATRTISTMQSGSLLVDSVLLTPPLGVVEDHAVVVHLACPGDADTTNNHATQNLFLSPAFNIRAQSITVASGCKLHAAPVTIKLKNEGRKPILGDQEITIGYQMTLNTPNITVANLPIWHEETITLGSDLPVGIARDVSFNIPANLYPTGNDMDIVVKGRGWVSYQYDLKQNNDTSANITINSYYTPQSPVGEDLHIPYATWDTIWASQANSRPIRWYRDSTRTAFYMPSNYNNSRHWDNTPQYFHDSTYYLNCLSTKNCASHFSTVHVYLNPRVAADVAAIEILSPQPQRVYTENDTVRVKIINYSNTAISNIPVVYQVSQTIGNQVQVLQEVTEIYTGSLAPDAEGILTFDSLLIIPESQRNQNKTYNIHVWTDLPNEMIRMNDTIRENYVVHTLPESAYCTATVEHAEGLDITRVSFNTLDWVVPELGRTYNNFGTYTNPEVTPLHLTRGTTDSITIEVASSDDPEDHETEGRAIVYLDTKRNGSFVKLTDFILRSRVPETRMITIPSDASYGYMKMRIVVDADTSNHGNNPCYEIAYGNVQDYLVFIDAVAPATDIAATHIVTPREHIVDTSTHTVGFSMANKGASLITSASVHYTFTNITDGSVFDSTFLWSGGLAPGYSTYVPLPAYSFTTGTTILNVEVSTENDSDFSNNNLFYEYHLFHVEVLNFEDNFDDDFDMWYAPVGSNNYSYNYWQRGVPNKSNISVAYSAPNVWITGLNETVTTGKCGNLSVLYSPKFDLSSIRSDTLSFMLAKNMSEGSYLTMQYYNYRGYWVTLDASSATNWYDDENGFTGNSAGYGYQTYKFPTSIISGEFSEIVQFRFIYRTPITNSATASYGDGCAIDNFKIKRGQRAVDAGIVAITHPTQPKFGQTIQPTVVIQNFGYDTLRSVPVAYRPYGTFMPREEVFTGAIAPNGGTATYTFSPVNAFVVTNNYPDTFQMCAFTRSTSDLYHDNDTVCQDFVLYPLDNDMSLDSYLSPTERIVAGDSAVIQVRMRNFGQAPVSQTRVACIFNGADPVIETVDFESKLGRPLQSMEFFNYTFTHKFRTSMGAMSIISYVLYDEDDYIYNDTIKMNFNGIAAISDLKAREVIVDTTDQHVVKFQLVIDNVGARLANNFEVGFFVDNDTSAIYRETFSAEVGIPSLSCGFYSFQQTLPTRTARYDHVCAFIHIDGDNDPTNDTTTTIASQYVDIKVRKVQIEENMYDTCHVRLELENIGNMLCSRQLKLKATINGQSISTNLYRPIAPGQVYHVDFNTTIAKSPTRTYQGVGSCTVLSDILSDNNSTDVIEVINYFEGIPLVDTEGYALGQNYPNPFHDATTIDFRIPVSASVRFAVVDIFGRIVYQTAARYAAGEHSINLSADILPAGVYFYSIECNGHRFMRKMIIQ